MRIVVFLGPSLPRADAAGLLDAEFHPPISLGDLCDLLVHDDPPDVVGIVDGFFEQVPSVWHKEILYAIERGVHVFGASSMGALRAAEMHPFGMRGVGEVFERFRSGRYEDDDEVAIVHCGPEDGYRPLSEAMVNIRHGLERAERAGVVSAAQHGQLVAAAKAMFYPDRSWPAVVQCAERLGFPACVGGRLREFVRRERPDVKRADAEALLATIAAFVAAGVPPAGPPAFAFEPTYYWDKLVTIVRDRRHRAAIGPVVGHPTEPVDDVLSLAPPDVLDEAFVDLLVAREARRLGLHAPDVEDAAARLARFRTTLTRHYRAELSGHVHARLLTGPPVEPGPVPDEPWEHGPPRHTSRTE
jgi:hypothetical protein